MTDSAASRDAILFDIDGTLVDSTYHHALAWHRAFTRYDVDVPMWRVHRTIGMGGDKLVAKVAGEDVEERARRRPAGRVERGVRPDRDRGGPVPRCRGPRPPAGRRGLPHRARVVGREVVLGERREVPRSRRRRADPGDLCRRRGVQAGTRPHRGHAGEGRTCPRPSSWATPPTTSRRRPRPASAAWPC